MNSPASTSPPAADPYVAEQSWRNAFLALENRDFRIFLSGLLISASGGWVQGVAQSWLVYRLTQSTVLLGTISFATHLPVLLLGPLAGIVADRYPRRRVVMLAQTVLLAQACVLAWLTLSARITTALLIVLAGALGIGNAFEIPARQSLYVRLVGRPALMSAIALNSVTFNLARLAGPSLGGFVVARLGEGLCFLLNAVSFSAVLASLFTMRVDETERTPASAPVAHLREGLRYVWSHRRVRNLLFTVMLANVAGTPIMVLGPVFADQYFHRGSEGLGLLTGAIGLGAVAGTLGLARRGSGGDLKRVILVSAFTNFVGQAIYALSSSFLLSIFLMMALGYGIFRLLASANTLIQTSIEDDFRGRVMSLYSMTVVGMLPIGGMCSGVAGAVFGPRETMFGGAMLSLCAALWWRLKYKDE